MPLPHVFISYSRKDFGFAGDLRRDLSGHGVCCWIDQYDIYGMAEWREEIARAIRQCDVFLIVLSPDSVQSAHVRQELAFADSLGRRIVPVWYRQAPLPDAMALILGRLQHIDFVDETYEAAFERLARALEPAEAPAPPTVPKPVLVSWIAAGYILIGLNYLASFGVCWADVTFGISRTAACLQGLDLSWLGLGLINFLLVLTVAAGITLLVHRPVARHVLLSHWLLLMVLAVWALFSNRYWPGLLIGLSVCAAAVFYVMGLNRQDKSAASRFSPLDGEAAADARYVRPRSENGGAS